jgi:hypothetical protein
MNEPSPVYTLSQELFDTFRNKTDLLSADEVEHMTNVEGIVAFGRMNKGDRVSQRLSLGKNGMFYLSTVFHQTHPSVLKEHITPTSDSNVDIMLNSLFYRSFKRIIQNRNNQ